MTDLPKKKGQKNKIYSKMFNFVMLDSKVAQNIVDLTTSFGFEPHLSLDQAKLNKNLESYIPLIYF